MTIVVCMKITPDTSQLGADPASGAPRLEQAPRRISTFDENALEEAVRLAERRGGRVVAVTLAAASPPRELLLKALAMGADEFRLVLDPTAASADALATAKILSRCLDKLAPFDVVLCGEGSLDEYGRQVGPRIAEEIGLPVLCRAVALDLEGGTLRAERSLEDRIETVECRAPAVVTVGAEINEPRLPTVLQILGASRKPIVEWGLEDLGFEAGVTAAGMAGVRTLAVSAPRESRQRIDVAGETTGEIARHLARALAEKGLVGSR